MVTPSHLSQFHCGDYFDSVFADEGFWDKDAQLEVIVSHREAAELPGEAFFMVGRAGADGILFGYRSGLAGLWAYSPIEGDFQPIAATVDELVERWMRNEIQV